MEDSKKAWDEVSQRFSQLGRTLGERHRDLESQMEPGSKAGSGKIEEALRAATEELDRAFTALGDTLRDPAAKEQIRAAGRSLGDALQTTFSEAGERIRRTFGSGSRGGDAQA
jgi:hypothetical protein